MAKFKYVAMDSKGAETEGVIESENKAQAIAAVRASGFFPTRVAQIGGSRAKAAGGEATAKGLSKEIKLPGFLATLMEPGVKAKNLMVFTRQLATLIEAGLPLLRGLNILVKQENHPTLKKTISALGESVESGSTFSEGLAQHPKVFDKLFVNMIRAGEAGGVLDVVLVRLAQFMEKAQRIKNKVKGAMVYPIVVLCLAVIIMGFMLVVIIPKFDEIFKELLEGAELPVLTQHVVAFSNLIQHHWLLLIIVIAGVVIGTKTLGASKYGRVLLDRVKLKAPLIGPLYLKTAVSRFTRTLGTLLTSGVPILQALNIVRETAGNEVISKAISRVHDSVKEGDTITMPLAAAKVFPDMVVSMIDVGEETGALPDMLMKIAETYDDEVDMAVEGLTSVIEPLMIVALALVVGTGVIAMFLPMVSIITKMSN